MEDMNEKAEEKVLPVAEQIALAQKELDEQESAHTAATAQDEELHQLQVLKARKKNNELFAELQAKSPSAALARVEYDDGIGMVVVKRPTHLAYRQLQDQDKVTSAICEKFVIPLLVYPDKASFVDLITSQCKCDLLNKATIAAKELAEANARVIAKK